MIKTRLLLPVLAAAAALALLAGCGSDSGGSASTDPASVAPADTPVFIEGKVQPSGELKTNVEELASRVAGIEDLGGTIVSYIEQSASEDDEPIDFEKEIQPWLGESAGIFLPEFDGEDFQGGGFALEVTDTGEAQEFIDKQAESEDPHVERRVLRGRRLQVDADDEEAIGIVGNFIVFGEDKSVVRSGGRRLRGRLAGRFQTPTRTSPPRRRQGSLADVYVDIGGMIEAAG